MLNAESALPFQFEINLDERNYQSVTLLVSREVSFEAELIYLQLHSLVNTLFRGEVFPVQSESFSGIRRIRIEQPHV